MSVLENFMTFDFQVGLSPIAFSICVSASRLIILTKLQNIPFQLHKIRQICAVKCIN